MSRYDDSRKLLERAERSIPLGSQTFSKSRELFPPGLAPQFARQGKGGILTDVDGNDYVDLVSALASVTLGYADAEINAAVIEQLGRGVTLSLATEIESDVAERIIDLVPCAEMVRFGKNGSDGTSAAIRLSRAHTGRDHVIVCGYHGWHDWYIGSTPRGIGVPEQVSGLAHSIPYGDLEALNRELSANPIAAVIMEPMAGVFPPPDYLADVKTACEAAGALLIFDETVTGFRFAAGGAQEYFDVTPDLACFGKGMANGFPVSAVTGRRDLMIGFEKVFFSGTFGGETLALTAARVVLDKIKSGSVIADLNASGDQMWRAAEEGISAAGAEKILSLSGHPTWAFLNWNPDLGEEIPVLKLLFMQEMCRNGVLVIATHNVMTAHTADQAAHVGKAYENTMTVIREAVEHGDARSRLDAPVVSQAVTVR